MQIVSARDFRSNQTSVLRRALKGESVVLTSRVGLFKILPVDKEDTLTTRICEGLKEVEMMEKGVIQSKSARDFLNEL